MQSSPKNSPSLSPAGVELHGPEPIHQLIDWLEMWGGGNLSIMTPINIPGSVPVPGH